MAAYNAGGSLTWSAVLNASQFHSGIQSMLAQMAYAQRASSGLQASLAGIATVSFAAVVGGIGAITASIAIASKATADWETQMMGLARVAIPEFDYTLPEGKAAFTEFSRAFQGMYLEIPVKNREELTKAAEPYALAGYEGQALYGLTEKTLKMMQATNYELSGDDISNLVIKSAQINRKESGIDSGDPTKILQYSDNLLDAVLEVSNKYTISTKDLTNAVIDAGGSAVTRGNENDIPGQLAFYALLNQYGVRPDLMRTMLSSSVSTAGMAGDSTARIESALNKIGMKTRDAEGKKIAEFSRAEVASKLLGVTVDQYQKMANTDMNRTQIRLIDAIENLDADRLTKNALGTGMFGAYAGRETSKLGAGGAEETYTKMEAVAKAAYTNGDQVESQYQNMFQTINAQWDLMGQRLYSVKELFGEIFQGPVLAGIKSFSESAKGAVQWLTKIVDSSRNLDGTVNTWNALKQVASDLKQKFVDLGGVDFLKAGGVAAGLLLIATNLGTIKTAAGVAAKSLMTLAGVTLGPTATALLGLLGPLSAIGLAAAGVAVGLAAIGYSLAPEKFTYFNQVATEAINGVSVVVKQLYTDLSTGDWSAAATHLKNAFMATIVWLGQIDWGRLGSEIVTMIGDGAKAIIDVVLDIGGWIYDSLSTWVKGNGPYKIGKEIGDFITDGLKTISTKNIWEDIKKIFGVTGNWLSLGIDIVTGIGNGLQSGLALPLAQVHDMFLTSFANLVGMAVGIGYDIANAIINGLNSATEKISSIISGWMTAASQPITVNVNNGSGGSSVSSSSTSSFTQNMTNSEKEKQAIIDANDPGKAARIAQQNENARKSQEAARAKDKNIKTKNIETLKQNTTSTNNLTDALNEMYGAGNYIKSNTVGKVSIQSLPEHQVNELNRKVDSVGKYAIEQWNNFWSNPSIITESPAIGGILHPPESITDAFYSSPVISEPIKAIPDALNTGLGEVNNNLGNISKSLQTLTPTPESEIKARQEEAVQNVINKYGLQAPTVEERIRKEKEAAIEAKNITTSGATSSVNILKDGIFESTISWKDATKESTDYSTRNIASYSDFVNATSKQTAIETSNITKESYGAVRVGLLDSGKNIAVIGKVAQQQFETSGGKWVNDTIGAGYTFNGDTTAGGTNAKNSMSEGGDIFVSKVGSLNFKTSDDGSVKTLGNYINELKSSSTSSTNSVKTLGEYINELKSQKTGSNVDSSQLLRNVEDITCMGDRVMVNTGVYTSPTGEQTAFNPMDNEGTRLISGDVEGEFTDMTCMGQTVTINGLKYTNPYGVTSYINPMEYNSGGGVLDYQQQANTTVDAAKDAGKITVDTAKTSSEYQKGSTNYQAQSIQGTTQRWVTTNEYMLAKEENAAIQNGEMWRNNVDFFTSSMDATYFRFDKMNDENVKQAYDYMGSEATVNDKKYQQNMETIKLYEEQISGMRGVNSQLGGLVSSIDSAGANLNASFGSMLASLSASMGNRSGTFGGTSIGGGGQYVGMGSTNPANAVPWGGTAASIYAQMNSTMPRFGSVSWGAKGSLIEEPTRLIAGEKGRELLLPNNLTELFMKLAALGFNNVNGNGGSGDTVVIVNIDGEQVEKVVSRRQKRNLNLKGLKLH